MKILIQTIYLINMIYFIIFNFPLLHQ